MMAPQKKHTAQFKDRVREELIKSERVRVRQILRAMKKRYRYADPEERAMIREAMEDYARGELRRIAG